MNDQYSDRSETRSVSVRYVKKSTKLFGIYCYFDRRNKVGSDLPEEYSRRPDHAPSSVHK